MFSVSFLLRFKQNPNKTTEGGTLEGIENATIAAKELLSDYVEVRNELFSLGD